MTDRELDIMTDVKKKFGLLILSDFDTRISLTLLCSEIYRQTNKDKDRDKIESKL